MNVPIFYSFILSQIFGLFMLVILLVLLSRKDLYRSVILSLKPHDPIVLFASVCSLLIGVILVDTHSIFVWEYRSLVTLVCWMIFINSLIWLIMPESMLSITQKVFAGNGYYWFIICLATAGVSYVWKGIELVIVKHSISGLN